MPSRFAFFEEPDTVKKRYNISDIDFEMYKYYNIKPTNRVIGLVSGDDGSVKLVKLRWGFVKGKQFFKARADSIQEKRLFSKAFRERRCLILANGFFEWDKDSGKSIPYYFKRIDNDFFTIAGIFNSYVDEEDGEAKYQFAVITIEANDVVAKVFHRMPAILAPDEELEWLKDTDDVEKLQSLLKPFSSDLMESYEVEALPSKGDNGPDTITPKSEVNTALDDFF